jgi:PAS domain S-box-containing protein
MQRAIDEGVADDGDAGSSVDPLPGGEQLLQAVIATSSDGILAIDADGRIAAWNARFLELWSVPNELIHFGDSAQLESFMSSQMRDPAGFLRRLRDLDASPVACAVDVLELASGRTYERTTRRNLVEGAVAGRVSGFHDVTDHRAAQEALRISEASYRTIFDLATDAIYVHDPVTGAVLDVNQRAIEFHGLSREDFARLGIRAVSAGESPYTEVEALANIHRAAAGEPQLFTWRARHSSGRMLWIEVSLRAAVIDGENRVLATARDVTQRLEAEAVLHRSQDDLERAVSERTAELAAAHAAVREREEQYRALADADPDGIVLMDDASTILSVNPAMEAIFGYAPEELIGQHLPILMPEELRDAHRHGVERYLASGRRAISWLGVQVPGRRKDGSAVQLEINFGEYTIDGLHRFAGFIRDITERKRAEEALLFQSTLLEAQNEAAIDGILVAHQGQVLSMNRRYAEIFNVPEELRPLERCQEMLRWAVGQTADPESYLASIERLRHDPEATHRDEVLLADGRVLDRYTAPLKSPEGHLYGRIWVIRDITGRKRIEEALQSAKEEAERANLAKSEFLSRMSHELRTPLNSILGFGQVLARRDLPEDQRKNVDHIMKAGRHLLSLIDEVLDIARIEANRQQFSLEPVHLAGILDEALALIRPMALQRPVRVPERVPAGSEAHVRADRQRLMQVVLNLLSNAVKYNRPGGSVELIVQAADDGGAQGRLTLGVRDTGPGIPSERMGELFVPFSRLGAEEGGVEGTGLGLALSQRLVEAMNGQLRVESTPGEGSTFWVELPLAQHPLSRLEGYRDGASPLPIREPVGGAHRILYVEDNLANLNLVESIFEHRPEIQLLPALQGRLGLELAREHSPDLILLDLHLPDMKGEDVLRELRSDSRTSDIPVLVISADATPRQITRLRMAGARGYLTKPLDLDEFLSEVDAALADGG